MRHTAHSQATKDTKEKKRKEKKRKEKKSGPLVPCRSSWFFSLFVIFHTVASFICRPSVLDPWFSLAIRPNALTAASANFPSATLPLPAAT